jgi:hypothetical protein
VCHGKERSIYLIAIWSLRLASKADGRCSEGLGAQERLVDGGCGVRQGRRRRCCVAVFGKLNNARLSLAAPKRRGKILE